MTIYIALYHRNVITRVSYSVHYSCMHNAVTGEPAVVIRASWAKLVKFIVENQ